MIVNSHPDRHHLLQKLHLNESVNQNIRYMLLNPLSGVVACRANKLSAVLLCSKISIKDL